MMPLPNVTGALHMGHAMDNVMQDLLIRWHRMMGDNTLWMPGTDHAGIGTQAVVEKRLFELEGKTRHDIGREGLVARIQAWKDEYRERIIRQQQSMGCSCDWKRQRFTMDAVCARAVREAFFRLFRDGLIYRGNRMVNWDCQLQTAVSDDEIVYEKVQGHFWHIKYPIVDPRPGEPDFLTVATTRPETMLGDTAVAVHPDPAGELEKQAARPAGSAWRRRLEKGAGRARGRPRADRGAARRPSSPASSSSGTWPPGAARSSSRFSTGPSRSSSTSGPTRPSAPGCVKITPGHDPNDYEVWERHKDEIGIINILNPDGTLNANAGPYAGPRPLRGPQAGRRRPRSRAASSRTSRTARSRSATPTGRRRRSSPTSPSSGSSGWATSRAASSAAPGRGRNSGRAGLAQAAIDAAGDGLPLADAGAG